MTMKYCNYALAILLSLILTACGGSIGPVQGKLLASPTSIATLTTTQLDAITAGSGLQPLTGKAKCTVTIAQINYQTSGVQPWEFSNASGAVLVPGGAELSRTISSGRICQGHKPL